MKNKQKPAQTISELSLKYDDFTELINFKLDSMAKSINDLSDVVKEQNRLKADQRDLDSLSKQVESNQKNYISRGEARVGYTVLGLCITVLGIILKIVK